MGRLGKTCGAVTGALMVIGLKYGKAIPGDETPREKTYDLTREFIRKFENINSTTVCRDLIGYDLTDEQGLKKARASGVFQTLCRKYIADAVKTLEDMGF